MAITIGTLTSENVLNPPSRTTAGATNPPGSRLSGSKLKRFPVTVGSSGDTWTYGGGAILDASWGATDTSDPMAVTWASANVVTFTGTNGSVGYLYLWVNE